MHMLQSLGKRCRLECADEIAPKYSFMAKGLEIFGDFEPKFITAVDVADIKLLSDESAEKYSGRVDLCIDHHGSNTEYAKEFCVDSTAAACAEILCPLADELGVSRQTVISLERGRFDPSLPLAFNIATLFGCRIEDVFTPAAWAPVEIPE